MIKYSSFIFKQKIDMSVVQNVQSKSCTYSWTYILIKYTFKCEVLVVFLFQTYGCCFTNIFLKHS